MQDRLRDLVQACKQEGVKVSMPKKPTPYKDIVKVLKEKGVIGSNDLSDSEGDEVLNDLQKNHEDGVKRLD